MRSCATSLTSCTAVEAQHLATLPLSASSKLRSLTAVVRSNPGTSLYRFEFSRIATSGNATSIQAASCSTAGSADLAAFQHQQRRRHDDRSRSTFLQCWSSTLCVGFLPWAADSARRISTSRYSSSHRTSSTSCSAKAGQDAVMADEYSSMTGTPTTSAISEITSTANPYIKHCVKLRQSAKYRQQQQRLLLVGATLLTELAEDSTQLMIRVLFLRPGMAVPAGITAQQIITVSDAVMKKLSGLEEAAGATMAAELVLPQLIDLLGHQQSSSHSSNQEGASFKKQHQVQRLLVLEGVQDPGNLGTLLRCAAAFGWDAVWLLPGCCDPFNDKALRASRAAALRVPLAAGTLQELLTAVKQHRLVMLAAQPEPEQPQQQRHTYSTALSLTETVFAADSDLGVCLVLGTEGAGLSDSILQCATRVAIPMSGRMESLNVAVAGSILMFALSEGMPQLLGRLQQLKSDLPV